MLCDETMLWIQMNSEHAVYFMKCVYALDYRNNDRVNEELEFYNMIQDEKLFKIKFSMFNDKDYVAQFPQDFIGKMNVGDVKINCNIYIHPSTIKNIINKLNTVRIFEHERSSYLSISICIYLSICMHIKINTTRTMTKTLFKMINNHKAHY